MKASFKNFKELKSYIDNDDSSKVLKSTSNNSVSINEDAIDVFINIQRKTQEAKQLFDCAESVNDIEKRYIWLSKGG
jgi:mevalonate pyrophosphate decarboxylase